MTRVKDWATPHEVCAALIALSIVALTVAVLYQHLMANPNMDDARTATAILTPLLGTVMGFYFGSATGQRAMHDGMEEAQKMAGKHGTVKRV